MEHENRCHTNRQDYEDQQAIKCQGTAKKKDSQKIDHIRESTSNNKKFEENFFTCSIAKITAHNSDSKVKTGSRRAS